MKKTSTLLLLLLLCAAPLMFTGCGPSEDETLAMLVDGGWDGVMDISYTLDNGMTYKSTGSHVQFWSGSNLTSGYGKWCNNFPETADCCARCVQHNEILGCKSRQKRA